MKISVIVPVYGSPGTLRELVTGVTDSMKEIGTTSFEIILVNDRCPKHSWATIEELVAEFPKVTGINLSRNFGQHYAILAGLEASKGDWVVVMDCDLQDNPSEIPRLYVKAQEGFDLVYACRTIREDGYLKKVGSKLFYNVLSYATGTKQDARIANFGIYSRKVINAVISFKERLRFFPVNVRWLGFNYAEMDVKHNPRSEGESSYSLKRLLELAFNVIFSFSDKPMNLLVRSGAIISMISVLVAVFFVIRWLSNDISVAGWTGIMVSIWFMFGVTIFALGIVGIYVAKAFDESKNRPLYIVDDVINGQSRKARKSK